MINYSKYLYIFIFILLSACGDGSPTLSQAPSIAIRDAFYDFDETSGAVAHNSSGDYFHGDIINAERVPGKVGNALNFGIDTSGHIDLPVMCCSGYQIDLDFPNDTIMIEAWIHLNSLDLASQYPIVANPHSNDSFKLAVENGRLVFYLYSRGSGNNESLVIESNTVFTTNTWYYIALTYDASQAKIYINGAEDNSRNIVHPVYNILNNLYIGGNGSVSFPGIIDEFYFSTTIKSAEEVSSYYNATM